MPLFTLKILMDYVLVLRNLTLLRLSQNLYNCDCLSEMMGSELSVIKRVRTGLQGGTWAVHCD